MNENLELLFQEIEKNPENLLTTLLVCGEYTEETELQEMHRNWIEQTEMFLNRLKTIAKRNNLSESVEIIADVLDNMD